VKPSPPLRPNQEKCSEEDLDVLKFGFGKHGGLGKEVMIERTEEGVEEFRLPPHIL
jgi:hypothetical protein